MSHRLRRLALVLGLALATTACGIRPDAAPRDVPDDQLAEGGTTNLGGAAVGAGRIYLVGPGEDRLLRSVSREASTATELIQLLLRGPNDTEVGFGSAIPATTTATVLQSRGSTLRLDVSADLLDLTGPGLVQALAQIVYTASEIPGVESVEISVDNSDQAWPTADLDSTIRPLTIYDYPAMVRTAQPAYPSVPSGG